MSTTFNYALNPNNDFSGNLGFLTNPFFEISQERGLVGTTLTSTYIVDQWFGGEASSGALTGQAFVDGLSSNAGFRRLRNGVAVTASTAASSYSATDNSAPFIQPIEGTFWKTLGWGTADAKSIDVVFVAMSTVSGTYALGMRNSNTRSYVTTFNLVANVPTIVFKTIPGDTSGTWATNNNLGAYITIGAVTGTNFHPSTLDSWNSGNFFSHSSVTNWTATLNAVFRMYYCQIFPKGFLPYTSANDPGLIDTICDLRRPYDVELRRCQRYYQFYTVALRTYSTGTELQMCNTNFITPMRTTPSTSVVSGGSVAGSLAAIDLIPLNEYSGYSQAQYTIVGDGYAFNRIYALNARM